MRETCKHGHPWTPENLCLNKGYFVCRVCARESARRYRRRCGTPEVGWLQRAVLAALRANPAGLTARQVHAKIGYRSTYITVKAELYWLRVRKGLPIIAAREGTRNRYVLAEAA